ncbi:hypothetical protein B5E80_18855 [Flavonifractor sp. An135]|nr:hypothetical protein [Flavonifractor sp. An135]OUQ16776.1 hypothetical protein B5E80_18855 [Flavonifractor sp. An135]
MDYKKLVDLNQQFANVWKTGANVVFVGGYKPDSFLEMNATAITDLLARAEAAEARAEKAEKKLEAAVKELDGVAAAVDDLSDFIDEQIHPLVPYDFYTALRENADAISMWEREEEWRVQKEE